MRVSEVPTQLLLDVDESLALLELAMEREIRDGPGTVRAKSCGEYRERPEED